MRTNRKMQPIFSDSETIELQAPTGWKELDEKQLKYAAWLLTQKMLTEQEIRTYAFIRFTGIKPAGKMSYLLRRIANKEPENLYMFTYRKRKLAMNDEEILWYTRKFGWMTEEIDEVRPLEKMARCKASDLRLRNAPLKQYLACENYYQAYLYTQDERYLNKLCASFYTDGKFNDNETEKRSLRFGRAPLHERYTVFLWFSGLKKVLKNHFPHYFIVVDNESGEKPQIPNMRKQLEQMMRALSGGDVTKVGALYEVETWTALAELDAKAHEYETMKRKIKTNV